MRATLITLLLALVAPLAPAQELPIVEPDPALRRSAIQPMLMLGRRAEQLRRLRPVSSTLVIAANERDAADEIARWKPDAMWPVLIDDGSERTTADIARFIRAFQPARVLMRPRSAEDQRPTRAEFDRALLSAWNAEPDQTLDEAFADVNLIPPGVVVADDGHPPAIAALALAAGRGQPILWVKTPLRSGDGVLTNPLRDALRDEIDRQVRTTPWSWETLGDQVDALTLCLNTEGRVWRGDERLTLAITDHFGRRPDGRRWAYTGWIRGEASAALYDAMCALFIVNPESAWLFDGYAEGFAPSYAADQSAAVLTPTGLGSTIISPPGITPAHWRSRTRAPLDAGLIHVNSSGDAWRFELSSRGTRAYASDVPPLDRPAIVHFIHSFSAQRPGNQSTLSARWLDEGAYAYLGSVDEPLLGAFMPSHVFLRNMLAGAAFGAAVRREVIGPWRLQVFGDPLVTISRATANPPALEPNFEGYTALADRLSTLAGKRDVGSTLRTLVMLGRTERATQLARAALDSDARALSDVALRVILSLAERAGDPVLGADAARLLPPSVWDDPRSSAMLWRTLRPALSDGSADQRIADLLRGATREESAADDARALGPLYTRLQSKQVANAVLRDLIEIAKYPGDKKAIENMIRD